MKNVAVIFVLLVVSSLTFADEIKVLSIAPNGEITISANTEQAKPWENGPSILSSPERAGYSNPTHIFRV